MAISMTENSDDNEIILDFVFRIIQGHSLGTEKICIWLGDNNRHLTIMSKKDKNTYDFHIKIERPTLKYEPILEIDKTIAHGFLESISQDYLSLLQKYWLSVKMNQGKMTKHQIYLMPIESENYSESPFFDIKNNGKKISAKKSLSIETIENIYLLPEVALKLDKTVYMMYKNKNNKMIFQGIAIRFKELGMKRSTYFMSNKKINQFTQETVNLMSIHLNEIDFSGKDKFMKNIIGLSR